MAAELIQGHRSMLDDEEWAWIVEMAAGDFDHLLFGTSLPFLLGPGLHHLEAASEAVCAGAWGKAAARFGESVCQLVDLEHWSAFHKSFTDLAHLLRSVAAGERTEGGPPASVTVLSGNGHHGYLAKMDFGDGVETPVYQSTSSPLRNPLGLPVRLAMRLGWSERGKHIGEALSRLAGVEEPDVRWHLAHEAPWFHNHISSLEIRGRKALLKVEKPFPRTTRRRYSTPFSNIGWRFRPKGGNTMKVVTARDMHTGPGPEDWFTGTVWRDAAPVGAPPDVAVNRVLFEPGARTHWHTHPEGQILYIVTGTCRAAREGEAPVEVESGGVVYFAPDEKHWHGATPETYMVHMAINVATTTDGGTDWLEPVVDEEYAGE